MKGIDVSYAQGKIDWQKVKADGIDFAILRCGFGEDIRKYDDVQFFRNATECDRLGIPWGAYLYSYATCALDAKSEAAHVMRLMRGFSPMLPIFIDMEDADGYKKRHGVSNKMCVEVCKIFCDTLIQNGHKTGIYANKYWLDSILNDARLDGYDRWLAQWAEKPTYSKPFHIWQYNNSGRVAGISGNVDMNICYKDYGTSSVQPKPPLEEQSTGSIVAGDHVLYAGRLYADSFGGTAGKTVDGIFKVERILAEREFGILLEDGIGWAETKKCIKVVSNVPNGFKVGARCRVSANAEKFATGENIASWLKGAVLFVRQVADERILLSTSADGALTGWFRRTDVEVI